MDFLQYWNLKEKPFENTGDPKFFYYSPEHKEALVRLIYVIRQNKAGALLAGDYGTGKTTIANELLAEVEESRNYQSVYISNPLLNPEELLQEIVYQLSGNAESLGRLQARRAIDDLLQDIASRGDYSIIIVDEAHLITQKEVLEELRLMMNLQYKNRFLVTLIMMGQLELREIINSQPQFKQRFAICYMLQHLNEEETIGYIKHRMKIAGAERRIFTDEASSFIYNSSSGKPRQINNICDMSLLVGYMRQADEIDGHIVRDVSKDLGEEI
ncbi:MAG: ExeA family protein [Candidatus Omnitrophota bacterium]